MNFTAFAMGVLFQLIFKFRNSLLFHCSRKYIFRHGLSWKWIQNNNLYFPSCESELGWRKSIGIISDFVCLSLWFDYEVLFVAWCEWTRCTGLLVIFQFSSFFLWSESARWCLESFGGIAYQVSNILILNIIMCVMRVSCLSLFSFF